MEFSDLIKAWPLSQAKKCFSNKLPAVRDSLCRAYVKVPSPIECSPLTSGTPAYTRGICGDHIPAWNHPIVTAWDRKLVKGKCTVCRDPQTQQKSLQPRGDYMDTILFMHELWELQSRSFSQAFLLLFGHKKGESNKSVQVDKSRLKGKTVKQILLMFQQKKPTTTKTDRPLSPSKKRSQALALASLWLWVNQLDC